MFGEDGNGGISDGKNKDDDVVNGYYISRSSRI